VAASKKASKKKAASKKAARKKSAATKAPKKKASEAKAAKAKSAEPRPGAAKSKGGASAAGARRSFSLTAKQAATLQAKLSDCPVAWGLEVRTGDDWVEATGKTALAEHDDWLFNSKDGLVGGERSIEGFELGVAFDKRISELPPLGALSSLGVSRLSAAGSVSRGGQVTDISSIGTLKGLKSLDLSNCTKLEDTSPLATLKNLETLKLSASAKLEKSSGLAGLKSLKSLDLSKCGRLSDVSSLSSLKRLETLDLSGCEAVEDISDLGGLKALQELDLSNCVELGNISALGKLKGLQSLDLSGCQKLTDISPLVRLKDLEHLNLSILPGRASKLEDISVLAKLKSLRSLNLSYFKTLQNVSILGGLKNLQNLWLSGCTALDDVSTLAGLRKLEKLDLSGCQALTEILDLGQLRNLRSLNLKGCAALSEISHLAGLAKLDSLNLSGCGNIRDLENLAGSTSLRSLNWTEAPACHDVLAACAAKRQDSTFVMEQNEAWIQSFRDSKDPDRFAQHLIECFSLGGNQEWAVSALTRLLGPARDRQGLVLKGTWAKWSEKVLALGDPDLREPIEKALTKINPEHELAALLGPVLTALAGALPRLEPEAQAWATDLVEASLARHESKPEEAQKAAPAAVVFYMALDENDEGGNVKKWLERGTVANMPSWRDKVQLALIEWQLERDDQADNLKLEQAMRRLRRIQTPEFRNQAHAALARRFDVFDAIENALDNHLEAITDEALKAEITRKMAEDPRIMGSAGGFSTLLLALQDDREALSALMDQLIRSDGANPLVAAIHRSFDEEARERVASRLADIDLGVLDGDGALALVSDLKALIEGRKP